MKRRILAVLSLVLILASVLVLPAGAAEAVAEETPTVSPRYVNIIGITASIGVNSSGKASCYSFVETANTSYTIYLVLGLQRYEDGYWTTIKEWSGSGTGEVSMDKSRYVTSGYYYRTAASATVYTSGGSYVESTTLYSQSTYY